VFWKEGEKMKVENLYCDTITYKPRKFDFSGGYGKTWEIPLDLTEEERENEEFYPVMNYIYPLPLRFEKDMATRFGDNWRKEIKKRLVSTTLIFLCRENEYCLALTGAGMNFAWEICESYINLGYLPPFHFCKLPIPRFFGKINSKNKRIIQACLRTVKLIEDEAKRTEKHLKSLLISKKDE